MASKQHGNFKNTITDIGSLDKLQALVDSGNASAGYYNVAGQLYWCDGRSLLPVSDSALSAVHSCSDTINGIGVLKGQTTESGQTWLCTGAGYLTTIKNGNHIEGSQNTYCHIDTGKSVNHAIQYFSGPIGTVSIGLDTNLTDMVHCNFTSGAESSITYWKTGIGTSQAPKWHLNIANTPNINDGLPHKLELYLIDNFAIAYCDGVLLKIAYDDYFPSLTGNFFFAQVHGVDDKIYGVESFSIKNSSGIPVPVEFALITAGAVFSKTLTVGNEFDVGFLPISSSYFHTADADGHVFSSTSQAIIQARAQVAGYGAKVGARSYVGTTLDVVSNNDGSANIAHQGNSRITFPFNTNRIELSGPVKCAVYTVATLPAATTVGQRAIVSDALTPSFGASVVGGGAVVSPVYSDGSGWKVG